MNIKCPKCGLYVDEQFPAFGGTCFNCLPVEEKARILPYTKWKYTELTGPASGADKKDLPSGNTPGGE